MTDTQLDRENYAVLMLNQALWGAVDGNMRGVAVEVGEEVITVHFAVSTLHAEVQEELDDIVSEFDAFLLPPTATIQQEVHIGSAGPEWAGRRHRLVFLAKL